MEQDKAMKRQSIEDYQRARAEQRKQHTTPGDEERKQRIKANGLECLRRLHGNQTWEDWMGTGAAMMVITEEAMAEVGASEWDKDNKRLVKEFNERWDEYEARALRKGTNDKPLSKQERWALREVMTNPEIGAWRGLLDGPQQRRLNHPNAIVNKWKASTQTREPKAKRPPSDLLSPALTAKNKEIEQRDARIAELEEELQAARESKPVASGVPIHELIHKLGPIVRELKVEGRKTQVTMSVSAVARLAEYLHRHLNEWAGGREIELPKHKVETILPRKLREGMEAEAAEATGALVWTQRGDAEPFNYAAPAAKGNYSINPVSTLGAPLSVIGYAVKHAPLGVDAPLGLERGSRHLGDARTVEKAKAIAQKDHDAGRDRWTKQ
jgi:hypothetical protein